MINVIRMLTVDEGTRTEAYKDTKGKTSVGIGFNMDDPLAVQKWKQAGIHVDFSLVYLGHAILEQTDIWNLLNVCIDGANTDLKKLFSDYDTYPDYVKLALVNLMFNLGAPVFSGFHTFIGLIKRGDYAGAANDLNHTNLPKEEPNRVKRIQALLQGDDSLYS